MDAATYPYRDESPARERGVGRRIVFWCGVVLGVAVVLLVILDIFGGSLARGPLERTVAERTGRALELGSLDFRVFSRRPGLSATQLRFANASWSERPLMLDVAAVDVAVRPGALLLGRLRFSELNLATPKVVLERNAQGEANWIFDKEKGPDHGAAPAVESLSIDQGELDFIDPQNGTAVHARVSQEGTGEMPLLVKAEGRLIKRDFKATAQGQAVLDLMDADNPYHLKLEAAAGDAKLHAQGTLTGVGPNASFQGKVNFQGDNLSDLSKLTGIVLPNTGPYLLAGDVARSGDLWELKKFRGRVGKSDVAGDLSADLRGERPAITATLRSALLDLADLGGFIGSKPGERQRKPAQTNAATTGRPDRVLPDKPFELAGLRRMDAQVELVATQVRRPGPLPLDNFRGKLVLKDGTALLTPLSFGMAGGDITANVRVAIEPGTMKATSDLSFRGLQLDRLLPKVKSSVPGSGRIDGSARLSGTGRSFADILSTLDGRVGIFMRGGEMSSLLTELIGLDAGEAMRFLLGGDRKNQVRCAAAGFDASNGVLVSNVLVFDTDDTNITGNGQVNLAEETLDVKLYPQPKDRSFGVLRVPIRVQGKFAAAEVTPDKGALALRAGGALLLGMVNPLAALIPLIETGGGKDAACDELLSQVQRKRPTPAPQAQP